MNNEAKLLNATRTMIPAEEQAENRFYLLVLDGGSSSFFHLPRTGVVLIGRVPEADLRLQDNSISRRHARITLSDGEATIADLDSHNGTKVNGQLITGGKALYSGDVVTIGDITLVFHCGQRPLSGRSFLDLRVLRQRLEDEIERTLSFQHPLAVIHFALPPPPNQIDRSTAQKTVFSHLRLIDVASWVGDDKLVVLLPELREPLVPGDPGDPTAREFAEAVLESLAELKPGCRAGFSFCPADGCDPDTLLAAARSAAESAPAGKAWGAAEAVTRLDLDGRKILVADPAMGRLFDLIQRLAKSDLPVLIAGETGAGKENAAFAVHYFSPRHKRPFVALNCAALQDTLMESELFGYEKGAFSGANHSKAGLLESATGGTIFFDEVGELSASAQSKLLRALEVKRITRLGDVREREIDIRIVAATNRTLEDEVRAKRFRQDLFFRLSAATIVLPPLRDRPREITLLAQEFLTRACQRADRQPMEITPLAMHKLATYNWPGNVRELRNIMDFAAAAVTGEMLEPWHLPEAVSGRIVRKMQPFAGGAAGLAGAAGAPGKGEAPSSLNVSGNASGAAGSAGSSGGRSVPTFRPLADEIRELERRRITEALSAAGGMRKRAAELIGMPLRTFVLRLKQHGLGQHESPESGDSSDLGDGAPPAGSRDSGSETDAS